MKISNSVWPQGLNFNVDFKGYFANLCINKEIQLWKQPK
jgi:hypothetical protein